MGQEKIPHWWLRATLGELTLKIVDGSHNPPKKQQAGLPMLSAINISGNKIEFSDYRLISEREFAEEHKRTRVQAGDVLLTIVGAIGRTAVVPEEFRPFTLQRSVAVFTPALISPKFLMYQLESPRVASFFKNNARGTAQKGVYLGTLGKTEIWFPGLSEQHRIVAKIEELFSDLDKGIESLETARGQLQVYRHAVFKNAFEGKLTSQWREQNKDKLDVSVALMARIRHELEALYQVQLDRWISATRDWEKSGRREKRPVKPKKQKDIGPIDERTLRNLPTLPVNWIWVRLGQLTWSVKDGPHYSPKYQDKGIPFISGGNVRPEGVDFSNAKFISRELHDELCQRCRPEMGDILYTKGGTTGIARVNTYDIDFNVWVHIAVLKIAKSVEPFFLQHALNSHSCYTQAQRFTHGVGNQDLGLTRMVNIILPICEPEEQRAVICEVERLISEIDQLEKTIDAQLNRTAYLRQSVLKNAFAGKLVAQDRNDEPASILLERIRAKKAEKENGKKITRRKKAA